MGIAGGAWAACTGRKAAKLAKEGVFVQQGAADLPWRVFGMQKGSPDTAAGGFCMLKRAHDIVGG